MMRIRKMMRVTKQRKKSLKKQKMIKQKKQSQLVPRVMLMMISRIESQAVRPNSLSHFYSAQSLYLGHTGSMSSTVMKVKTRTSY